MNRSTRPTRADGRQGCVRDVVRDAVSAAHTTHPAPGAPAGQQAIWWHNTATALDLIADHEADSTRAHSARADADVARRLSRGLALTHAHALTAHPHDLDDATAASRPDADADVDTDADNDVLEVSWP